MGKYLCDYYIDGQAHAIMALFAWRVGVCEDVGVGHGVGGSRDITKATQLVAWKG
jgi:hypothetical protein